MADEEPIDPASKMESDPLWQHRGLAIGAYGSLEQALFRVFQNMLETTGSRAAIVFFRIVNTSSRNTILEKLIQDRFGNEFNLFWNSFFRQLKIIDGERNEIAHWASVFDYSTQSIRLIPPNFWAYSKDTKEIDIAALKAFIEKCETFSKFATRFSQYLGLNVAEQLDLNVSRETWLRIFHEPLIYPLPSTHPLNKSDEA